MKFDKELTQRNMVEACNLIKYASEVIAVTYPGTEQQQRAIALEVERRMLNGVREFVEDGLKKCEK